MCRLVRCTVRRAADWRVMRMRVLAARRCLEVLLSMSLAPLPEELSGLSAVAIAPVVHLLEELSGNLLSAPTIAPLSSLSRSHLLLLRFLEGHHFADVAHALALVRLGRLVGADLGGDLPHLLAVHALDHDLRLRRRLGLHALGERMHDRMREAEREV